MQCNLLVAEIWGNEAVVYFYDASGAPAGFAYSNSSKETPDIYFYEKNIQGDIVAIYNTSGTKLISYTYDAWGNFTVAYYNSGNATTAVAVGAAKGAALPYFREVLVK